MTSRTRVAMLLTLMLSLCVAPAFAQDETQNMVRTRLEPANVAVGEPASLYIDILTTGFFIAAPDLPALEIPGAIVKLSDERSAHLNEQIKGVTWYGIEHRYEITPIVAAPLTIPAFDVTVHPGPAGKPVVLHGAARQLPVSSPPGAGDAFVTHDLTITQKLDAAPELKVGDAITRTVRLRALGTPAMFIPPLPVGNVAGVKSYPQSPQLEDESTPRSAGVRIEQTSYVLQQPGRVTLPGVHITWWSLDKKALETATTPDVSFDVVAAPPTPAAFTAAQKEPQPAPVAPRRPLREQLIDAGLAALAIVALGAVIMVATRLVPALLRRQRARHASYRESEAFAFGQLQSAMRGGDAAETAAALYHWLDRVPGVPSPARAHWLHHLDERLLLHSELLVGAAYGSTGAKAARRAISSMERYLPPARRRWLRRRDAGPARAASLLPPLNPA
jgi:hypothetical protein